MCNQDVHLIDRLFWVKRQETILQGCSRVFFYRMEKTAALVGFSREAEPTG